MGYLVQALPADLDLILIVPQSEVQSRLQLVVAEIFWLGLESHKCGVVAISSNILVLFVNEDLMGHNLHRFNIVLEIKGLNTGPLVLLWTDQLLAGTTLGSLDLSDSQGKDIAILLCVEKEAVRCQSCNLRVE